MLGGNAARQGAEARQRLGWSFPPSNKQHGSDSTRSTGGEGASPLWPSPRLRGGGGGGCASAQLAANDSSKRRGVGGQSERELLALSRRASSKSNAACQMQQ